MVMLKLREGTRTLHSALENAVDLPSCWRSRERYAGLLRKLYGMHAAYERQLIQVDWTTTGIDFEHRSKLRLLEADFAALEIPVARVVESGLPDVQEIDSLPAAIGCLYVLEGATLGGQVILKQINRHLSIDAGNGGAFFASYGARVKHMWLAFSEAAQRCCDTAGKQSEALHCARRTFAEFTSWLRSNHTGRAAVVR